MTQLLYGLWKFSYEIILVMVVIAFIVLTLGLFLACVVGCVMDLISWWRDKK